MGRRSVLGLILGGVALIAARFPFFITGVRCWHVCDFGLGIAAVVSVIRPPFPAFELIVVVAGIALASERVTSGSPERAGSARMMPCQAISFTGIPGGRLAEGTPAHTELPRVLLER